MNAPIHRNRLRAAIWGCLTLAALTAMLPLSAQQAPAACTISGRIVSGTVSLPGVSVIAFAGDAVKGATSTDTDGTYRLVLPAGTYRLSAELTGFESIRREVTTGGDPCDQTIDLQLALAKPTAQPAPQAARPGAQRFETLAVQTQAGAAGAESAPEREAAEAATRMLLPPGFSTEGPTEAVAVTGTMASLDRGMMNQRFDAIGRGEFDPVTGEFAQGFGPGGRGGPGDFGGRGGRGGPGGAGDGQGGRGGPGGPGGPGGQGFVIGGRGGRQNLYSGNANYTFGGSALDSSPYHLRADSQNAKRPYT